MKYQILGNTPEGHQLAQQVGIERLVEIWRFPTVELTNDLAARLLDTGSLLATLDHPCIPHLIDVRRHESAYEIITEFHHPSTPLPDPTDIIDVAYRLERLSDAIAHAHQRGVAHGRFSQATLVLDGQGEAKLRGLGKLQIGSRIFREAVDADAAAVRQFASAQIQKLVGEDEEFERLSRELTGLVDGLTSTKATPSIRMRVFHDLLQQWLQREIARREQQALIVGEPESVDADTPTLWGDKRRILAVCVTAGFVLCLLFTFVFWRLDDDSNQTSEARRATALTDRAAKANQPPSLVVDKTESELDGVGVFNARASDRTPQTLSDLDPVATSKQAAKSTDAASKPSESPAKRKKDKSNGDARPESTPQLFVAVPASIDLPDTDDTEPFLLASIPDFPLTATLRGGKGEFRQGTFVIESTDERAWRISHRHRESKEIAVLRHREGRFTFHWLDAAASDLAAKHLCNVVVQLSHEHQSAAVALRTAATVEPAKVDLHNGITRRKIEIDSSPSLQDVFIEFVPNSGGLSMAINPEPAPAADGTLRIALEAGTRSLFLVQVNSLLKKRRALELVPHSRGSVDAAPQELKKGAIRQLENEAIVGKRALFEGKRTVNKIKNAQRKKFMKAKLAQLERRLDLLSEIGEAFDAAQQVSLNFRVFRRVQEHEIDLLHIGTVR